jgi:DNA-directed RNA polymerase specialized sigma24 family protein
MSGAIPDEAAFATFVAEAEPRLRRALVALRGPDDGRDATAEALAYAWTNWSRVETMANPIGYLYRVGQSRSRQRLHGHLPAGDTNRVPEVEPGLGPALADLSDTQRTAVVLVHGCQWTYQEVADALDITKSSVGTHIARAMTRLRTALEVDHG